MNFGALTVEHGNFTGNSADEVCTSPNSQLPRNLLYSDPHFELIVGCKNFPQEAGAIYNSGALTVKYGSFTNNSAGGVCIIAPHSQCSRRKGLSPNLLYSAPPIEQDGGAIHNIGNIGTLTVKYGSFTNNSAGSVRNSCP